MGGLVRAFPCRWERGVREESAYPIGIFDFEEEDENLNSYYSLQCLNRSGVDHSEIELGVFEGVVCRREGLQAERVLEADFVLEGHQPSQAG